MSKIAKDAIRKFKRHFVGRQGQMTGNPQPYVNYLISTMRSSANAEKEDKEKMLKDLESYAYYVDALLQKKAFLEQFGGDSVRGITNQQRIENTAERCGLRMPTTHDDGENARRAAAKLGLGLPGGAGSSGKEVRKSGIREDLTELASRS